jgi:hypothetical protein
MSRSLANQIDEDLSASDEVKQKAREARNRGAQSNVDWEAVLATYREDANQDPGEVVRHDQEAEPAEHRYVVLPDTYDVRENFGRYDLAQADRRGLHISTSVGDVDLLTTVDFEDPLECSRVGSH